PQRSAFGELTPASVDFSPALVRLLVNRQATRTSAPNVTEQEVFRFRFTDEIVKAFYKGDPGINDENDLEFGISVAGIRHAWRWGLKETGVQPLDNDKPTIRAELIAANEKEVKPIQKEPHLLYADNWPNAMLDIGMHIHGGRFPTTNPRWELDLKVENTVTQQPVRVIEKPISLSRRHVETITASAGKMGAWNFSTHIEIYNHHGLKLKDRFDFGSGKYELIAQLVPADEKEKIIEHRTAFVFDDTPATFDDPGIPSKHMTDRPLTGAITAS
ncbi:MAG: hypothetical protein GY826_31050, partial [Fuerstiella sp.]|nr:hypothetical protein [Fuerstiella sp.]